MATVYQHSLAHTGFHPFQAGVSWLARRVATWQERRRHRRDLADLARFTDHELWDIGLARSDMLAIEKGVYRRD